MAELVQAAIVTFALMGFAGLVAGTLSIGFKGYTLAFALAPVAIAFFVATIAGSEYDLNSRQGLVAIGLVPYCVFFLLSRKVFGPAKQRRQDTKHQKKRCRKGGT